MRGPVDLQRLVVEVGRNLAQIASTTRVGFAAGVGDVACQAGADEPDVAALLAGEAVGGEAGEDPGVGSCSSHHRGVESGQPGQMLNVGGFRLATTRVAKDED